MSEETLHHTSMEKWPDLKSVFLSDWPRSLPGYNLLETQMRRKKRGFDEELQLYCPFGDVENGFIAVNNKKSSYDVIIQYPREDTRILEDALRATKVINWKRDNIKLAFSSSHVISCVKKVIEEKNVEMKLTPLNILHTFMLVKDSPIFEDISLPPGFTFDLLFNEYVKLIDSKWAHQYPTSLNYFEQLIDSKSGYGLYKDSELVSWIFISEYGYLSHLYTLETHRRNGYGELMIKLTSNIILKDNMRDVYAFCVKGNINAMKLYEKLGFRETGNVFWPDLVIKK